MTVDLSVEAEIRRLHYAEHWPAGTIASQLGVHPDVARRVLGLLEPRGPSSPRPRLVDPFVGFIEETLAQYPRLRATRLDDMLRARGYRGSVRTLREYVARVRPVPRREAFLRIEALIGEQAQVDWAHVGKVPVPGGLRSLWLFVMVLSWSRAMWAEFVFDTTVHSLLRSLVRAAAFFQGVTRQWLFDNPKIIVLERHGDAVRFHPLLLDLAGRFHVQLRLCTVRKANQKGRVERIVRFLRDRFLAARSITGLEQGNRELTTFLAEIGNARPHPVFRDRSIADCLAEERGRLLALPDPLPTTARTLRLLDLYKADLLAEAVAEVLARGMHDPGALAQVCEQRRRAKSLPVPVAVDLGAHVPDREVIPHDLESYDAQRRRD
jgi:transposase